MNELELEVFRSGSYGAKGEWTDAMLDGLAEDYRAETHEAPVTLDHGRERARRNAIFSRLLERDVAER